MAEIDLAQFPATVLMRWYATMISWGIPEDLPVGTVEPDFEACIEYKTRFPKWYGLLRSLETSLTQAQQSWGWWREKNLGSFDVWQEWFAKNHKAKPTIDIHGEPLP